MRYRKDEHKELPWLPINENDPMVCSSIYDVDEFEEHAIEMVKAFCKNMKGIELYREPKISNEWFNLFLSWLH
jgi:hypothetical protein